jgi:hypothetical protein
MININFVSIQVSSAYLDKEESFRSGFNDTPRRRRFPFGFMIRLGRGVPQSVAIGRAAFLVKLYCACDFNISTSPRATKVLQMNIFRELLEGTDWLLNIRIAIFANQDYLTEESKIGRARVSISSRSFSRHTFRMPVTHNASRARTS